LLKRISLLGFLLLIPYAYALILQDLREQTAGFEWTFYIAFALYTFAVWLVVREKQPATFRQLAIIFAFGIAFRAILVFSQPKLSDDMYRYVWDGRVQASGVNPYLYAPDAPELATLRDRSIWPLINRKDAVTVYPAGAELAFAASWRISPDNVHGFQVIMAGGDLLAGLTLVALLRALGRNPLWVLIYLWSPLVIFETAHAAHIDGLVLPLLVGAWLARIKGRDALTGLLLGVATAMKLYPILLLPVLWRMRDPAGGFRPAYSSPLAFLAGFLLPYMPYLSAGTGVIGYLPNYVNEQFNRGAAYFIGLWAERVGWNPGLAPLVFLFAALVGIYLVFLLRPTAGGEGAIRRCIWPIGAFTLLTQNLFPWYMLWLIPLLAIFLPLRSSGSRSWLGGLHFDSWTGWWLFCGLVGLSYTFFIRWKPVPLAAWLQFMPLYIFLFLDFARGLRRFGAPAFRLMAGRQAIWSWRAK
jgi:hypothetical protein